LQAFKHSEDDGNGRKRRRRIVNKVGAMLLGRDVGVDKDDREEEEEETRADEGEEEEEESTPSTKFFISANHILAITTDAQEV